MEAQNENRDWIVFGLPRELQIIVVEHLGVEDVLAFRLVSRKWHALISQFDRHLAASLLRTQIPPLAASLVPPPTQSVTLRHICNICHKLRIVRSVAYRMIVSINWDTGLRSPKFPKATAQRLAPRLFVFFCFLESYREEVLRRMSQKEPIDIGEIEQSILESYDSTALFETLKSVRDIKYLFGRLLAPSLHSPYFSSRGHEDWRPSRFQFAFTNEDSAAVFCIGGPSQIRSIWEIEDFEERVETAEGWVADLQAGRMPIYSSKHHAAGTDLPASSMNISASPPLPPQALQQMLQHLPHFPEMYEVRGAAVLESRGVSTSGGAWTADKLLKNLDTPPTETLRWELPTGRFWNPPHDMYNRTRVPDHELDD